MAIHIKPEALSERIKIDKNMDIVQKTTSTPSSSNRIGTFGVDGRSDIGMIEFKANYFGATKILQVTKKFSIDGISTTTTTTTTTTTPKPTQYTVSGTFAVRLFYPQMVMVDLNGDKRIVDVEFTGANGQLITSYSGYRITTTFNPAGYKLRVNGQDSLSTSLTNPNYWAGEITLPRLPYWSHDASTGDYSIIRDFTSSILTTTTTSTTTAAPTTYEYTIQVNSTNIDMLRLEVTVFNGQTPFLLVAGSKSQDGGWTFNWRSPVDVPSGWKFEFAGTGSYKQDYSATLTNQTFVEGVCTINYLTLLLNGSDITDPIGPTLEEITDPFSVDNPEDTNSLDDAINDYLNEQ